MGCQHRVAVRGSQIIFHRPYGSFPVPLRIVTPEMAESIYRRVTGAADAMDAIAAAGLKLPLTDYRKLAANGQAIILTADQALKVGVVQAVVDP